MRNGSWLLAAVVLLGAGLVGGGAAIAQDQTPHQGDNGNPRSDEGKGANRSSTEQGEKRPEGRANNHATQGAMSSSRATHSTPRRATPRTTSRSHRFMSQGRYRASIHAPAFQYPAGYSYQRWADGGILPRVFLDRQYYYGDYGALGLAAPPNGYEWIRYGTDLLLVNVATGRIGDVVDNVFY